MGGYMTKNKLKVNSKIVLEYENYIRDAENNNDTSAMYNLGIMHSTGELGEVNYAAAAEWHEKAANLGLKEAQYNLGFMYDIGQGVKRDFEKAMQLYLLAANQGDALAQHNIGALYQNGEGVPVNISEAKKWYAKACSNGNEASCQILGNLSNEGETQRFIAIKQLKALGDKGGLDGRSIKQIKQYLKGQGITESFDVWKEVKNGYLGIAMGAIDHQLYDFAQSVEEMQIIENHCMEDDFSDFVTSAISDLKNGKSKPPREVKNAGEILEDNILDTLHLLDFELDFLENSLESCKSDRDDSETSFLSAVTMQGLLVRFGDSLRTDKNEIADSLYGKIKLATDEAYENKKPSLVLKDIKSIRNTISKAEKYHRKYVRTTFSDRNTDAGPNKTKLSQLKKELSQIKQDISGFDSKIAVTLKSKSQDFEKLSGTILNLEAKYNKIKEAFNEGRRSEKSAESEINKIQKKISKAKNDRNKAEVAHDLYISSEVKKIENEKSKALELKKVQEEQIEECEKGFDPFASRPQTHEDPFSTPVKKAKNKRSKALELEQAQEAEYEAEHQKFINEVEEEERERLDAFSTRPQIYENSFLKPDFYADHNISTLKFLFQFYGYCKVNEITYEEALLTLTRLVEGVILREFEMHRTFGKKVKEKDFQNAPKVLESLKNGFYYADQMVGTTDYKLNYAFLLALKQLVQAIDIDISEPIVIDKSYTNIFYIKYQYLDLFFKFKLSGMTSKSKKDRSFLLFDDKELKISSLNSEDYDEKNAKVVNKKYADEIAIMLLLAKFIAEAQVTQEQLDQSIK